MNHHIRSALLMALLPLAIQAQRVMQPSHANGEPAPADLTHETHTLRLEEEKVWVHIYQRPGASVNFVSLHDNENTSADAAMAYIRQHGGRLVELRHGRGREVVIRREGRLDRFDPNRMFTVSGLRRTLDYYHNLTAANEAVVTAFAGKVAAYIGIAAGTPIIAVHNNSPGNLTIRDFRPGELYGAAAQEVAILAGQNPDDFFFTNSDELFQRLTKLGYNAALMRAQPPDIGSLGYLVNSVGGVYVLVEAGRGRFQQQHQMLEVLVPLLPGSKATGGRSGLSPGANLAKFGFLRRAD